MTRPPGGWDTPQNDTSFYLEEARAGDGPILELGCGTGRLVIPLLSTGFHVHGLDANTAMLAVARQKAASLSPATLMLNTNTRISAELCWGTFSHGGWV
jgi:2-polyprenyl-3-methyl-5-hydroxy-6-metoxy-1,4-benzoquinol methylase